MTTKERSASENGSVVAGKTGEAEEAAGEFHAVNGIEAGPGCARPMRADAAENHRRILEVAEAVFASEGVSVPVDVVAERAGVGVGTLYRHFPTKESLFEAIVTTRLQDLIESAKERARDGDAVEALFSFLHEFTRVASAKHDLFDAMTSAGIDIKSQCSEMVDELKRSVDVLLRRAVDVGGVRSDVSADEMIGLVSGACQMGSHSGVGDAGLQRMVDIVCDGLRTHVASARST